MRFFFSRCGGFVRLLEGWLWGSANIVGGMGEHRWATSGDGWRGWGADMKPFSSRMLSPSLREGLGPGDLLLLRHRWLWTMEGVF